MQSIYQVLHQALEISLPWNYVSNTMMEDMEPDNLLVQHLIKHLQLVFAIMVTILDTDLEVIG